MKCNECPRQCNIDRTTGSGFCKVSNRVMVARAALHFWEEPCISGEEGSGAVFFSGCNMQCVFCQNRPIATGTVGRYISEDRLAEIFLELQKKGANNINLVTPSHYVNQIIAALTNAKNIGLSIPIVYNTSAYEKAETIKKLDGYIDVYLPDCKYYDNTLAIKYSKAPDYHDICLKAIEEMLEQVGEVSFDERGMINRGVVVRHLVLPGHTIDSKNVLKSLYEHFGNSIYISVMNQYTPLLQTEEYPELMRRVTAREYRKVLDYALGLGFENGFMQEGNVAKESFIPDFDLEGV